MKRDECKVADDAKTKFSGKHGKPKGKGRSGKYSGQRKPNAQEVKAPERTNDVKWYTKYPTLSEIAGKFGFNHIAGKPYIGAISGITNAPAQVNDIIPVNVLACDYITTPGILNDATAGFTMQIRRLYLAMKRKYRGLNTYQIADLGVTLFAIAEFYRLVAKLERIYGVFNYFNPRNRIIPLQLANVLHVDRDDMYNHLADFRTGINALIIKAQSLCLPQGLDILSRWFLLESNIFKDSEDERASYIVFDDQNLFYTYQPTWTSFGGSCVLTKISAAATTPYAMKYQELLDAANDVLDILLNDDDVTLQLGDIISYFTKENGETELLTLQTMPEDYVIVPAFNEEIALQVHNSRALGDRPVTNYASIYANVTPSNFDVGARGSLIYYESASGSTDFVFLYQQNSLPQFNLRAGWNETTAHEWVVTFASPMDLPHLQVAAGSMLVNTWKEVPSSDDIIEMTRLLPVVTRSMYTESSNTYYKFDVTSCGTEVILRYRVLDSSITTNTSMTMGLNVTTLFQDNISANVWNKLTAMSQIDWHPMLYFIASASASATAPSFTVSNYVFADLDNARSLDRSDLIALHDAVNLSLFEISSVKAIDEHVK